MRSLCWTCGTQFAESGAPPARCPICDETRQFVPPGGQRWTTLEDLQRTHRNCFPSRTALALLTGDILQVTMDRIFVSFMRSYPNLIPLSRAAVESIVAAVARMPMVELLGPRARM